MTELTGAVLPRAFRTHRDIQLRCNNSQEPMTLLYQDPENGEKLLIETSKIRYLPRRSIEEFAAGFARSIFTKKDLATHTVTGSKISTKKRLPPFQVKAIHEYIRMKLNLPKTSNTASNPVFKHNRSKINSDIKIACNQASEEKKKIR